MRCWEDTGGGEGRVPIMVGTTRRRQAAREVEGEYVGGQKGRDPALVAGPGRGDPRCSLRVAPVGCTRSLTVLHVAAPRPLPVHSGHLPDHRHLYRFHLLGLEAHCRRPVPNSWLGGTQAPSVECPRSYYGSSCHRGV